MGTERQVPVARELALKVKRALRDQVGECLTCSIGIAPNVFLGKVGSDLQKPDGLVVITKQDLPGVLLGLQLARSGRHGVDSVPSGAHAIGVEMAAPVIMPVKAHIVALREIIVGEVASSAA